MKMMAQKQRRKIEFAGDSLELERSMATFVTKQLFNQTHGIIDPDDPTTFIKLPPQVESFSLFKASIFRNYIHAAHLAALDELLQQITKFIETKGKEGIGRALISFPPRHGKSTTISRGYPPWHIGRNPDNRVILASYGFTLAKKHSRAARNIVGSDEFNKIFATVHVSRESRAVDAWNIENHDGGMDAVGVGGGITGKGGDLIIVDDAVKNRKQAESPTSRENTWDWFTDDLYTRLEPGGAIIVVGTRWHTDDLIGRIKSDDPNSWVDLSLPAIAHENDPLHREPGEALWPRRYPVTVLNVIRKRLGAYSWSSLYDQNPIPSEGGLFKKQWFNELGFRITLDQVKEKMGFKTIVIALDPTVSNTESSDEVGIVVVALGEDDHGYILADKTFKGTAGQWAAKVVELYDFYEADYVVGETNHGGDLIEKTVKTADTTNRVAFKSVKASRGKFIRATPVAALYEQGKVHHCDYFDELELEMTTWSQGSSDSPDRMDAMVWGITYLMIPDEEEYDVILNQIPMRGRLSSPTIRFGSGD